MVTVEADVRRRGELTLVRAVLTNDHATARTVRLRSRLGGPVRPPRRNGVVDPRWNDGVWEVTIGPGRCRGVGFVSPAPPTEPPIEVVSTDRPHDRARSPEAVLATLDGWRPTDATAGGP